MSLSFENMTARQIADLQPSDIFPDASSALAMIRVLAARLADLEERFSGPITLTDESVDKVARSIADKLQPKDTAG